MIQIHDIWKGDGQKWGFIGRLQSVREDIEFAKKWKPKKLTSSWYTPSNTEFFNKDGNSTYRIDND